MSKVSFLVLLAGWVVVDSAPIQPYGPPADYMIRVPNYPLSNPYQFYPQALPPLPQSPYRLLGDALDAANAAKDAAEDVVKDVIQWPGVDFTRLDAPTPEKFGAWVRELTVAVARYKILESIETRTERAINDQLGDNIGQHSGKDNLMEAAIHYLRPIMRDVASDMLKWIVDAKKRCQAEIDEFLAIPYFGLKLKEAVENTVAKMYGDLQPAIDKLMTIVMAEKVGNIAQETPKKPLFPQVPKL